MHAELPVLWARQAARLERWPASGDQGFQLAALCLPARFAVQRRALGQVSLRCRQLEGEIEARRFAALLAVRARQALVRFQRLQAFVRGRVCLQLRSFLPHPVDEVYQLIHDLSSLFRTLQMIDSDTIWPESDVASFVAPRQGRRFRQAYAPGEDGIEVGKRFADVHLEPRDGFVLKLLRAVSGNLNVKLIAAD